MNLRGLVDAAKARRQRVPVRFTGDYATWEEARAASTGYAADAILEKVTQGALAVERGDAAYERDSVVSEAIEYSWPVLAGLLWVASRSANRLNVLDFGGALGTSYRQNRSFLRHLDLTWNVVEQPSFVRRGRERFETEQLRFYESVDECARDTDPNVALVSGSLGYVAEPYSVLNELVRTGAAFMIFDRTAFLDRDRLTVQAVAPWIYEGSYPAWILSESRFLDVVGAAYDCAAEFDVVETVALPDAFARTKGFVFVRRDST